MGTLTARYSMAAFFSTVLLAAAFLSGALFASCGSDSSSSSDESSIESSSDVTAPESATSTKSSIATPKSSATPKSATSTSTSTKSSTSTPQSSTTPTSSGNSSAAAADTVWNRAYLTWYISWPDPGSEECVKYSGCEWAGYFAGLNDQQTEQWVSEHNIISIHEKDWDKYKLKTFRLRQNGHTLDAVVYDKCSDSDCDGCCTQNAGQLGFLIDIESYSCERFSGSKEGCDGIVEWTCLDCE